MPSGKSVAAKGTLAAPFYRQLKAQLAAGQYVPGQKLPGKAALGEAKCGCSTVMREAIAGLRADDPRAAICLDL